MTSEAILLIILTSVVSLASAAMWFIIGDLKKAINRLAEVDGQLFGKIGDVRSEMHRDYIREERFIRLETLIQEGLKDQRLHVEQLTSSIKEELKSLIKAPCI